MTNEIQTRQSTTVGFSEMERMALAFSKGGLFGNYTTEQALSLLLVAQADGCHPATAMREYNIIQNRPALKADAMLARFQRMGGIVEWHELSPTIVSATFIHPVSCPKGARITWDIPRAQQMGYMSKDNWKKQPQNMLRSRVISEGVRTVYPGVSIGIYTPEEVQDMEPRGTVSVVEAPAETLTAARAAEMLAQIKVCYREMKWTAAQTKESVGFILQKPATTWAALSDADKIVYHREIVKMRDEHFAKIAAAQANANGQA